MSNTDVNTNSAENLQQPWASEGPLQTVVPGQISSTGPIYSYELLVAQGRVKGLVSDYRTGYVTFTQEAVYLQGQAVLPHKTRLWILVPLFLLSLLIGVIVSTILEYAARHPQFDRLSWDSVQEIVLEPKKGRVCLVYTEAEKPKPVYSLAFKPGAYYDNFVQAARYFAPEKVREGKIGPVTSTWAYVALAIILLLVAAAFYFGSQK